MCQLRKVMLVSQQQVIFPELPKDVPLADDTFY
jgi:hypothetical protein